MQFLKLSFWDCPFALNCKKYYRDPVSLHSVSSSDSIFIIVTQYHNQEIHIDTIHQLCSQFTSFTRTQLCKCVFVFCNLITCVPCPSPRPQSTRKAKIYLVGTALWPSHVEYTLLKACKPAPHAFSPHHFTQPVVRWPVLIFISLWLCTLA